MRLRFREAGIKRLEAVASGNISAETHLLKEKEEHLKEIEVLRTQVDRNQEVTRFAMENLRLKEEIRRLKSFCEEGERERMTEQIATLQNKLLEALDWKLMHESNSSFEQKLTSPVKTSSKDDLLLSTQDPVSPWRTSVSEENEFLRMQAIQNQSELDSLRRKLDTFVEEKQKLQSYVNELEAKHGKEKLELEAKLCQMLSIAAGSDQIELKTMVDAIAAASQREAEAHETAIFLSKENEGLKMKLKFLIDDNNKLIELYEQAMEENKTKPVGSQVQDADQEKDVESLKHQLAEMHEENDRLMGLYEKAMLEKDGLMGMKHQLDEMHEENDLEKDGLMGMKHQLDEMHEENDKLLDLYAKVVREKDELMGMKHQVEEMHEENDRLMGLYEKAMQEKTELMGMKHQLEEMHKESEKLYDQAMHENEELKQNLASKTRNSLEFGELKPQEKLVENDRGDNHEVVDLKSEDSSMSIDEESVMSETAMYEVNVQDYCLNKPEIQENDGLVGLSEEIKLFRTKLVEAQEKISKSVETMSILGSFERTIFEVDEISGKLERIESKLQEKQEEHESYKHEYSELNKKKVLVDRKWGALRYSLSNFSESINYFEQREVQTRARLEAASTLLNQKKDELVRLQACKDEILDKKNKSTESESKLKSSLHELKLKLEGETRRLEKDRVLISIENVDKPDGQQLHTQRNWQLSCRATELLMSEEMVTKFQIEMKQTQEKLQISKKQHEELNKQLAKVETQIHITQDDVEHASCAKEEMKRKLQAVIKEKETVLEMIENGEEEFERLMLEYHECVIETGLKQEEVKILEDELEDEFRQIEEMHILKALATSRRSELMEGFSSQSESSFLSGKVVEDLESVRLVIVDLNSVINGFIMQN